MTLPVSEYSQEEVPRGKGAESQLSLGPGPGKGESITGCGRNDGPWLPISFPRVSFLGQFLISRKIAKRVPHTACPH